MNQISYHETGIGQHIKSELTRIWPKRLIRASNHYFYMHSLTSPHISDSHFEPGKFYSLIFEGMIDFFFQTGRRKEVYFRLHINYFPLCFHQKMTIESVEGFSFHQTSLPRDVYWNKIEDFVTKQTKYISFLLRSIIHQPDSPFQWSSFNLSNLTVLCRQNSLSVFF